MQQSYRLLRWPWSCEFPDTPHSRDANQREMQAVFWTGRTFDCTAEIFPSLNGSRSWSQASKQSNPDCFLLLHCSGSPSIGAADWHCVLLYILPKATVTCIDEHPCIEHLQPARPFKAKWACVTGFVRLPTPPYLKWHTGSEKLLWGLFMLPGPAWSLPLIAHGEGWQMNLLCNP